MDVGNKIRPLRQLHRKLRERSMMVLLQNCGPVIKYTIMLKVVEVALIRTQRRMHPLYSRELTALKFVVRFVP